MTREYSTLAIMYSAKLCGCVSQYPPPASDGSNPVGTHVNPCRISIARNQPTVDGRSSVYK